MLLVLAEMGLGMRDMARLTRISRTSMLRWAEAVPEFRTAVELASDIRASVLSEEARAANSAPVVSYRLRILANIAAEDFRDKSSLAVGGDPDGPPMATTNVPIEQLGKFKQLLAEVNAEFKRS